MGKLKKQAKRIQKQLQQSDGRQVGERKKQPKNASKNLQKSLKIGSGTILAALWGGSGTSLAPGRPRARKGHQKAAKVYSVFSTKMETGSNLSWFFCCCVFWGARVADFSWFWVPEKLILAFMLALFWELWAFGETAESVVMVVNFRGLAPARLSLFTGPDCGGVSVTFLSVFHNL